MNLQRYASQHDIKRNEIELAGWLGGESTRSGCLGMNRNEKRSKTAELWGSAS